MSARMDEARLANLRAKIAAAGTCPHVFADLYVRSVDVRGREITVELGCTRCGKWPLYKMLVEPEQVGA